MLFTCIYKVCVRKREEEDTWAFRTDVEEGKREKRKRREGE